MNLDLVDIQILKYIYNDIDNVHYVRLISDGLHINKKRVRRRLQKLATFKYVKEVKSYPYYYIPNKLLKQHVDSVKISSFIVTPKDI